MCGRPLRYQLLCCCGPLYAISFTEQFEGKVNKELQDKKTDNRNDAVIDTAVRKQESPQLQFKRDELCDLPEEEEEETCNVNSDHNHLAEHRRQEERMVLEAGSKAAEIAKSVFGKLICGLGYNVSIFIIGK